MGTQFSRTVPQKGAQQPPPLFGPGLLWPNGWMDQDVLDRPSFPQNQMVAHHTCCRALVAQLTVKCPVMLQCAATFPPPQKLLLPPSEVGSPMSHMVPRPNRVITPNGISIGFAVSVWLPNAILYNALSLGKKTPKTAPSPWDFVTLPEGTEPRP